MKLIALSKQLGADLYSVDAYEERWGMDKTQPRLVSTIDPYEIEDNSAFFLDDLFAPGNWGAVDKDGSFLIRPQYLFASPFRNNRAIAAKGEWEYRDDWKHEGKDYSGYWYESELWGVIDENGNEIIPCVYEEVESVSYWGQDKYIVKVIEYKEDHKIRLCELVDTENAKILVGKERGYSDFGAYPDDISKDEFGQIVSAVDGSIPHYYGSNPKVGIFDLNTSKDIIKPQYGYAELCGRGVFLVGDLDENGNEKNGILINSNNESILKRNDIWSVWNNGNGWYEVTFQDRTKAIIRLRYDGDGVVKILDKDKNRTKGLNIK